LDVSSAGHSADSRVRAGTELPLEGYEKKNPY